MSWELGEHPQRTRTCVLPWLAKHTELSRSRKSGERGANSTPNTSWARSFCFVNQIEKQLYHNNRHRWLLWHRQRQSHLRTLATFRAAHAPPTRNPSGRKSIERCRLAGPKLNHHHHYRAIHLKQNRAHKQKVRPLVLVCCVCSSSSAVSYRLDCCVGTWPGLTVDASSLSAGHKQKAAASEEATTEQNSSRALKHATKNDSKVTWTGLAHLVVQHPS